MNTSQELYNALRSRFTNLDMGGSEATLVTDPKQAKFFDFDFKAEGKAYGRVSISLAEEGKLKLFYTRGLTDDMSDTIKSRWYEFLKNTKTFAQRNMLEFDARDITKQRLQNKDFEFLANTQKQVNTDAMEDITESMYGSSRRSYADLEETKLVIRHSKAVDETVPGSRSRHIDSLYIENADGERFKYPMIHLNGARAMQRHIANGGKPYDEIGESIIKMSETIASLNSFKQYASTKDSMNEQSSDLVAKVKSKLEALKEKVQLIQKQNYYEEYAKNFFNTSQSELTDEQLNAYREQFSKTVYDERLDKLFPLVDAIVSEDDAGRYQADAEKFIKDPNSELILAQNDARDAKTLMLVKGVTADDKNVKMRLQAAHILGDIASRMISKGEDDDKVANFASDMGSKLEREDMFMAKDPAYQKSKQVAFALAGKYMSDLKNKDKDEIRKKPEEIKKFKNIKGQEYGDKSKEYGKKEAIDESILREFETAMNMVTEGTWSLPETEEEFDTLKEIMSKHLPVGKDGTNAIEMVSKAGFGDDTLYDQIGDLADEQGDDACARNLLKDYVMKHLVNGGFAYKYSPEERAQLQGAVADKHEEPATTEAEAEPAKCTHCDGRGCEKCSDRGFTTEETGLSFEDIKDYVMSHFNTEEKSFPMGETGIVQSATKKFGEEVQPIVEKLVSLLSGKQVELVDDDRSIDEKKGKDHDKDGDVDSDDYLKSKDIAIKKAMGKEVEEAVTLLKRLSGI